MLPLHICLSIFPIVFFNLRNTFHGNMKFHDIVTILRA
jgi:hypothetical protein